MKNIGEKFIFSCGFLTIALFAALFFSPNKVLAAYNYEIPEINEAGNLITIPEYTGEAVLICFTQRISEENQATFTIGTATTTKLFWLNGGGYAEGTVSYLENPPIGIQNYSPASGYFGAGKCVLFKNYDSNKGLSYDILYENPYNAYNWDVVIPPTEEETFIMLGTGISFGGNDFTIVNASSTLIYKFITDYNRGFLWETIGNTATTSYAFNSNNISVSYQSFYKLNIGQHTTPPPPVSNNYITYYGDNPSYTIRRQKFDFPVVYNVCDAYNDYEDFYRLRFYKDDNTYLTSPPIGTENNPCSGIYTFSEIAPDYEDSGTGYISIIGELGNEIASTSPFLYTVYTPVEQVGAFIKPNFKSPVYADYYSATSTELSFYYDVCVDDNFNTSNEICIDFVDTGKMGQLDYNKTIHCQNLATCNGTINIDFPIETMDMTAYFRASYYSSNLSDSPFVSSNPFLFTLYNSDAKDTENIFSATSIHEMACSAEDWASDDWWNKAKCSTFETGLTAMNNIAKSFKITILKFVGLIKNTFPFNFINLIQDTWEESETVELPEKLQFLNFSDSNGDIKIPVKIGSATSTIPIFGKSIFQNNESKDSYEKIRDLSTWMFRAMVLIYATMIGIKIYHELSGNKSE